MLDHGLQLWTDIKLPIYKRNSFDRRVTDPNKNWIGLVLRCHVVFSVKFIVMIVVMLKMRMILSLPLAIFKFTIHVKIVFYIYEKYNLSNLFI